MAKKFRFPLQSVLDHREYLRQQAQIALSHNLTLLAGLQQEEADLQQELLEQEQARPHQGTGEIFMRSVAYVGNLKARLSAKRTQVHEAQRQVDISRQVLVEKTRDIKALELLREKQKAEFRKAGNVAETKVLDDFGTQQFLRAMVLLLAVVGLQFAQAGNFSNTPATDFGNTVSDSSQIAPDLSDSLSLGIDFLLFHQMLDTALNQAKPDGAAAAPKASNSFGSAPLVGVGPNGLFRAVFLQYYRATAGVLPYNNNHYVFDIDPMVSTMQMVDTIGRNNHKAGTLYQNFYAGASINSTPITPEYYSVGNRWAALWSNNYNRQGPLARAHWSYPRPTGTDAHFVCKPSAALPAAPVDPSYYGCVMGTIPALTPGGTFSIPLRASFAPLDSTMDELVTIIGPFRGYVEGAQNSYTVHVRWESISTPMIYAVDSFTVPTKAGLYHVAVAADSLKQSVIAWVDSAGTTLSIQAYHNTFATTSGAALRRGASVQVSTGLSISTTRSDTLDRNFNIRSIAENIFLITYARSNHIYYRQIDISSGASVLGPETQVSNAGDPCKYPDLAASGTHVAFAYARVGASGNRPEIVRYALSGTTLSNPVRVLYSGNPATFFTVGDNVLAANLDMATALSHAGRVAVAVDTLGRVLVGFNQERNARAVAYRDRDVFFTSGTFTSRPITLGVSAVQAGDSVQFGAYSLQGTQTNLVDFALLRNGSAMQDPPSGPFEASATFRYRLTLSRIDSFSTPSVTRTALSWNMQPRKPTIQGLRVGNISSTYQNFSATTRYDVVNRRDTVHLYLTAFDLDRPSSLQMHVRTVSVSPRNGIPQTFSWSADTVLQNSAADGSFTLHYVIPPLDLVADSLVLQFQTEDSAWASPRQSIVFRYRNLTPTDQMRIVWKSGLGATLDSAANSGKSIRVQMNDSALVKVWMSDANDTQGVVLFEVRDASGRIRMDSSTITLPDTARFRIPLDPLDRDPGRIPGGDSLETSPDTLYITLRDPDTLLTRKLIFIPNHAPRLDSLSVAGYFRNSQYTDSLISRWRRTSNGNYLGVIPGVPVVLKTHGQDVDVIHKDAFVRQWQVLLQDTLDKRIWNVALTSTADSLSYQFPLNPSKQRAKVVVRLTDLTGARTFDTLSLGFPKIDTMGGWRSSQQFLQDSLHFVLGSQRTEASRSIAIKNTGTENLLIYSVRTSRNQDAWLGYQILWSNLPPVTDSTQKSPISSPLQIPSSGILSIRLDIDVSKQNGDKTIRDTLILTSSDFMTPVLRIPIEVKWDDLPRMDLFTRSSLGNPPPPDLHVIEDHFPFSSSLVFAFSEPIRTTRIAQYLKVYSRLDSTARGVAGITPMESAYPNTFDIRPYRRNGKVVANLTDTLIFTPYYRSPSDFFNTLPPPHTFMRADRIGIWISNQITDSAGNALDLRQRHVQVAPGTLDTVLQFRSDTTTLRVLRTWPENGGTLDPDEDIRIHFSKPLATRIIFGEDTLNALDLTTMQGDSNSSLRLSSRYSARVRTDFRSIRLEQGDSVLVFRPRYKFLSEDSVGVWISPTLASRFGQTLDGNVDGYTSWRPAAIDSFSFRFSVGAADFYAFPNPFDASKAEHREKGTITFKNLHQIRGIKLNKDIEIRIYTVDGTLVYSTQRQGNSFQYRKGEARSPQFDWNVRNNHGKPIASGVYMYTVTQENTVLKRGKVMVIR